MLHTGLYRTDAIYSSSHTWDLFIIIDPDRGGEGGFIHEARSSATNFIVLNNIEIRGVAG